MKQNIDTLNELVKNSNNIVFFGGAGVSTESGIPDFRSTGGIYNMKYNHSPEEILSYSFFKENPKEFYRFYKEKLLIEDVSFNKAHSVLARLEDDGKLKAIITQNIDGLHQLAGSRNVLELHGSIHRNYCTKCSKYYDIGYIKRQKDIPMCAVCGGIIKPEVVLYQEKLDRDLLDKSIDYISKADVLIVGGTSLNVYPAARLIDYYKKDKLVLINRKKTAFDIRADYVYMDSIGELLSKLKI